MGLASQGHLRSLACCLALALSAPALSWAQDEPPPPPLHLIGYDRLSPPEGGADEDATGSVFLLQRGERRAIHVRVRHLAPGATYKVGMSQGDQSAELGTITTHEPAAPPAPRCFKATLKAPEPPPPAEGGDPAGVAKHLRWPGRHHRSSTTLSLCRNSDSTTLSYTLRQGSLDGKVTALTLDLDGDGAGEAIALALDEELKGSIDTNAEQLAALASGDAVASATTDGGATVSGAVAAVVSFIDRLREHWASRRAGSGALKLDTEKEDAIPFGATDLRTLVGAKLQVSDAEGAVVLAGEIGELHQILPRPPKGHHDDDGDDDDDAPGDTGDEGTVVGALEVAPDADFFAVSEVHDTPFIRGDANMDQRVGIADSLFVLTHLFIGGQAPYCGDAADANDSGELEIGDPVQILIGLFINPSAMPGPYPQTGADETVDELYCNEAAAN